MMVVEVHQETEHLMSVRMASALEGSAFHFRAGQYVHVSFKGAPASAFAIASEPEVKQSIEFLVKDDPDGPSDTLAHAKPDDPVNVSPPMGNGFPVQPFEGCDLLLVGIGTGLAPLRSVLKSVLRREHSFGALTLVYGVKKPEEVPFHDDFTLWRKKIRVEIAVSNPGNSYWPGFEGRVTDFLKQARLAPECTVACVCGSEEMERETAEILRAKGIPPERILFNH